jgi:hypothetical protein
MCLKCGECFTWLPENFDMRHRFNRETHQLCGGEIELQDARRSLGEMHDMGKQRDI